MSNDTNYSYLNKWSQIPYPNQEKVYHGLDNTSGSWPLYFIKRTENNTFTTIDDKPIAWQILHPCNVNFSTELDEVKMIQSNVTPCQIGQAKYWGTGVPISQLTPIALELIKTYSITPAKSARIMSSLHNVINDAFVMTWYFKYLWDYPRPCQLDRNLNTVLSTPKFPTYPSGHSVVSGAVEILLSYYFPTEATKLNKLAEDASISRLYGGIHFKSDLTQGLRLGRQIGSIAVDYLKNQCDKDSALVDVQVTKYLNAPIIPTYC